MVMNLPPAGGVVLFSGRPAHGDPGLHQRLRAQGTARAERRDVRPHAVGRERTVRELVLRTAPLPADGAHPVLIFRHCCTEGPAETPGLLVSGGGVQASRACTL